jgi:hypothetical protein
MNRGWIVRGVCIALALLPAAALGQSGTDANQTPSAQDNQAGPPPLNDILAWIASNLPPQVDAAHRSPVIEVEAQAITFQGCTVTFTDTYLKYKNQARPANKGAVITTVIDLSKVSPEVKIIADGPAIQLHSDAGFPTHFRDWIISSDALLRHETVPDQLAEDDEQSNNWGYYLADAAMATRTVHAWHDAIERCIAKAVPKNLY